MWKHHETPKILISHKLSDLRFLSLSPSLGRLSLWLRVWPSSKLEPTSCRETNDWARPLVKASTCGGQTSVSIWAEYEEAHCNDVSWVLTSCCSESGCGWLVIPAVVIIGFKIHMLRYPWTKSLDPCVGTCRHLLATFPSLQIENMRKHEKTCK